MKFGNDISCTKNILINNGITTWKITLWTTISCKYNLYLYEVPSNIITTIVRLNIDKNLIKKLFACRWLVGFMVFNATLNNYWWRKPEYPEKTTDLPQVTDKLYHIMLYALPWAGFEFTTSVVIGTYCIGSCKSNYHTLMATTCRRSVPSEYHCKTKGPIKL